MSQRSCGNKCMTGGAANLAALFHHVLPESLRDSRVGRTRDVSAGALPPGRRERILGRFRELALCASIAQLATSAQPRPPTFDRLYVFGDSYSDLGTTSLGNTILGKMDGR